jgi:predicted hydrocarbon binding protein
MLLSLWKDRKGTNMAVDYDPSRFDDTDYTIGVLCSEFYELFGEKAKETISRICYQRGLALGKRLPKKKDEDFKNAIQSFMAVIEKNKIPAKIVSLEKNKAIIQGTGCPLGLGGRGRRICEIMMTLDQGIIEEASGNKIRFSINKTIAAGDDFCEVIFEVDE